MTDIRLSTTIDKMSTHSTSNNYPSILDQFTRPSDTKVEDREIKCAKVGTNKIVMTAEERENSTIKRVFHPVSLQKRRGPLMIHGKRWYFRLVCGKEGEYHRSRALMDDYGLNQIVEHMVVCFTPHIIPGQDKPFVTPDGNQGRIYAFFDSYLEFYQYMQRFPNTERAFFEVAFGELPQKPHFDIDIDRKDFSSCFPGEDIDVAAETIREAVITGCKEVLREQGVELSLERDLLQYSSHGPDKRSYHIVINNKCHDGNNEAKAFYEAVIGKVDTYTEGKYRGCNFIDRGVYSPRQQFRIVGCQKCGSGRPKVFYEQFTYQGRTYTHIYNEDVTDLTIKKLTIVYESLLSFTSGCAYLPSLIPPKPVNYQQLGDMGDLDTNALNQCLNMLKERMSPCPFSVRESRGHLIILKRHAPSHCPICNKPEPHEKEHPYMYVINGKVYWDCRRAPSDAKKFFVGYLGTSIEELEYKSASESEEEEDTGGQFMFGDYDIGQPTLAPITKEPSSQTTTTDKVVHDVPPEVPVEQRMQNVLGILTKLNNDRARKSYIKNEAQDVTGQVSLAGVNIKWTAGYR